MVAGHDFPRLAFQRLIRALIQHLPQFGRGGIVQRVCFHCEHPGLLCLNKISAHRCRNGLRRTQLLGQAFRLGVQFRQLGVKIGNTARRHLQLISRQQITLLPAVQVFVVFPVQRLQQVVFRILLLIQQHADVGADAFGFFQQGDPILQGGQLVAQARLLAAGVNFSNGGSGRNALALFHKIAKASLAIHRLLGKQQHAVQLHAVGQRILNGGLRLVAIVQHCHQLNGHIHCQQAKRHKQQPFRRPRNETVFFFLLHRLTSGPLNRALLF